jgi:hypothetical protein
MLHVGRQRSGDVVGSDGQQGTRPAEAGGVGWAAVGD